SNNEITAVSKPVPAGWETAFLYVQANKIAADSISNLYAAKCMYLVTGAQFETDKESRHDREGTPLQRIGDRGTKQTCGPPAFAAKAICLVDGRLGCLAASAVRADRLVNTAVETAAGDGRHCTAQRARTPLRWASSVRWTRGI